MQGKKIIIINDLRGVPIITAIKLKRLVSDTKIIAHESIFSCREYADYTPIVWKSILKLILMWIFNVKIINAETQELKEEEKIGFTSSLFSIVEDSSATKEKYPVQFDELMRLTLGSKDITNYLKANETTSVCIFNGRTASSYLVSKYCLTNSVNVLFYEYAGHSNGFRLFPVLPHALEKTANLLLRYFKEGIFSGYHHKLAVEKFNNEKLNSQYKRIANKKSEDKYGVAIFLGSDFEYTGVDPELTGVSWNGNLSFCRSVIIKYGEKYKYAIRCHPNSAIDPNWPNLYEELQTGLNDFSVQIVIYGPDSPLDSHSLILNSEIIVTDLSSIALDAIILGKQVDIFGNTDVKAISTDNWFDQNENSKLKDKIMYPFALGHNFLVFRFSGFERLISNLLFIVNRSFEKIAKIQKIQNTCF